MSSARDRPPSTAITQARLPTTCASTAGSTSRRFRAPGHAAAPLEGQTRRFGAVVDPHCLDDLAVVAVSHDPLLEPIAARDAAGYRAEPAAYLGVVWRQIGHWPPSDPPSTDPRTSPNGAEPR